MAVGVRKLKKMTKAQYLKMKRAADTQNEEEGPAWNLPATEEMS